jgi:hypothetical protein
MQLIGGLKTLLHDDGMTIRGAQKLLKENGVQHVIDLSPRWKQGSRQRLNHMKRLQKPPWKWLT